MMNHPASPSSYHGQRSHQDEKADSLMNDGITAIMAGELASARQHLERAAGLSPGDGRIWLWLSATTEDPTEQRTYLERALAADPNNSAAARGLRMLAGETPVGEAPVGETPVDAASIGEIPACEWPSTPTVVERPLSGDDAQAQYFQCPQCGGRLHFNVRQQEVTCQFCGHVHQTAKLLAADVAEQSLEIALPTRSGHRWAEEHQNLACEKCGAVSLIPPGVASDRCPYCASNRMIRAPEAEDLVNPQSIALLKVDEEKAYARLRTWLGKGGLTPGGLASHVERIQLQCTYFPFWTFDGMLELAWHAEANEGTHKSPRWVSINGTETEVFDDILIPGLKAQPLQEIKKIEPFNLKDLMAFEAHYLAGWSALMYDIPLSKASLKAREIVMRRIRMVLHGRVAGGREIRHLDSGMPNWGGMMFKLLLLPLWVGVYSYQGKQHRVLINGQTGKVSGSRPRNYLKLLAVAVGAMLASVIFLLLLAAGLMLFGR